MTFRTRLDHADYERCRRALVWNDVVPDRHPDVIARPVRRAEVATLVHEAARAGQRVSVKSGGHNWLGSSLRDGGMLIDLGSLVAVEVDVEQRVAIVEPGASHKVLADALVPYGLAFPIGHCPSVGLGGYLLAGGLGWNLREWGPACWNVVGADMVGSNGSEAFVDHKDADLLWALRGASAGFPGVVTRFHLALHPLPQIQSRRIVFAIDALPDLVPAVADRLASAGPGLEISLIARPADPDTGTPARVNVAATAFAADVPAAQASVEAALTGLDRFGEIAVDSGAQPVALNHLEGEGGWTRGLRYAADTCWVSSGYQEVGDVVAQAITESPSRHSRVVLAFGHLPNGGPEVAFTGFGELIVNLYATWANPLEDQINVSWVRAQMGSIQPFVEGYYIGETDLLATKGRLQAAYPAEKWDRLESIVGIRDPDSRFYTFLGAD